MLQKDLEPKENKDQAADKLSFALVSASEEVSNNNSGDGDDHGCDPDDGDRFYDRSSEESKCDSDSECVNTGCDSENKHVFVVDRCVEDLGTPYGHVDIYCSSHSEALSFGLQYADVYQLN